jgi:transposase
VDLGDQWSHFCILGLQGETLSEGQLGTSEAEVSESFQALPSARVVMEVGTHSPWMQETMAGVANPRLMEGSKRRKRKNDRIDAKTRLRSPTATGSCSPLSISTR